MLLYSRAHRYKKLILSKYKIKNSYIYYYNYIIIPNYNKLKVKLLYYIYNLLVDSYLGYNKTLEIL